MSNEEKQATDILNQLKSGTLLIKRKINGKKYPRQFFLHEHETYISYEKSRKRLAKPNICKSIFHYKHFLIKSGTFFMDLMYLKNLS